MELRRFQMKNENAEDFFAWCDKKGLSRNDLIYILNSIELNPEAFRTEELARELASRPGVESGNAGPYQGYEVKRKYSNDRSEITDAAVIVIPHLVF
ncbi:MAG: hypothetical protein IJ773_03930 [Lachnospiraceae bacterium]|nr:hypothetical protein [Lachnospiraceae bacterium]